jgi:hypothetical protein
MNHPSIPLAVRLAVDDLFSGTRVPYDEPALNPNHGDHFYWKDLRVAVRSAMAIMDFTSILIGTPDRIVLDGFAVSGQRDGIIYEYDVLHDGYRLFLVPVSPDAISEWSCLAVFES